MILPYGDSRCSKSQISCFSLPSLRSCQRICSRTRPPVTFCVMGGFLDKEFLFGDQAKKIKHQPISGVSPVFQRCLLCLQPENIPCRNYKSQSNHSLSQWIKPKDSPAVWLFLHSNSWYWCSKLWPHLLWNHSTTGLSLTKVCQMYLVSCCFHLMSGITQTIAPSMRGSWSTMQHAP